MVQPLQSNLRPATRRSSQPATATVRTQVLAIIEPAAGILMLAALIGGAFYAYFLTPPEVYIDPDTRTAQGPQ